MPSYTFLCPSGHVSEKNISFNRFDELKANDWTGEPCNRCGVDSKASSANLPTFYGAWRIGDRDFKDASEASGVEIRSSHDIDRLEKSGKMYAVTNPSRARSFKEKR